MSKRGKKDTSTTSHTTSHTTSSSTNQHHKKKPTTTTTTTPKSARYDDDDDEDEHEKYTRKSKSKKSDKKVDTTTTTNTATTTTASATAKEYRRQLLSIIKDLKKHEYILPFLDPLDVASIPSYADIIDRPMDITTLEKGVKSGTYDNNVKSYKYDILLIFNNCMVYNEPTSELYKHASALKKYTMSSLSRNLPSDTTEGEEEEEVEEGIDIKSTTKTTTKPTISIKTEKRSSTHPTATISPTHSTIDPASTASLLPSYTTTTRPSKPTTTADDEIKQLPMPADEHALLALQYKDPEFKTILHTLQGDITKSVVYQTKYKAFHILLDDGSISALRLQQMVDASADITSGSSIANATSTSGSSSNSNTTIGSNNIVIALPISLTKACISMFHDNEHLGRVGTYNLVVSIYVLYSILCHNMLYTVLYCIIYSLMMCMHIMSYILCSVICIHNGLCSVLSHVFRMYNVYRELSIIVAACSPVPTNMSKTVLNVPLVVSELIIPPPPHLPLLLLPLHHLACLPPPLILSPVLGRLQWTSITSLKPMLLTLRTPLLLHAKPC